MSSTLPRRVGTFFFSSDPCLLPVLVDRASAISSRPEAPRLRWLDRLATGAAGAATVDEAALADCDGGCAFSDSAWRSDFMLLPLRFQNCHPGILGEQCLRPELHPCMEASCSRLAVDQRCWKEWKGRTRAPEPAQHAIIHANLGREQTSGCG